MYFEELLIYKFVTLEENRSRYWEELTVMSIIRLVILKLCYLPYHGIGGGHLWNPLGVHSFLIIYMQSMVDREEKDIFLSGVPTGNVPISWKQNLRKLLLHTH